MLKVLRTVGDETQAAVICGRLLEAGIPCMQRPEGRTQYTLGTCSVLVEDHDYTRAGQVLAEDYGGFDEEELARLSDQAARHARESIPRLARADDGVRGQRHWLRRFFAARRRQRTPRDPFGG